MQFHISNVLSEFDARFDDAMLRRPFIGRRQRDHGSRGRVSPENSPGHPANTPGGRSSGGRVSPENSPGHPANAPGGGVDTGDHDGDEKYGSDAGGSSSPSNDNSPGHPANAPGGSTGSTGPGAGGPSVGGGGGGSSSGRVSPENSPGHPANAPTTGGTTGSDDDDTGGGNANFDSPNLQTGRNDVDSDGDGVTDHVVMVQEDGIERWYAADDRYREGYATGEYRFARTRDDGTRFEAQVDDEGRFRSERTYGASTYEDGTTVTHRDTTGDGRADAIVANRPDGSVEIIRDTDGDGAADQVMVEDASGLIHIYSAEEWAKERQRRGEFSGEATGAVTQANSEAAWDADKPTIDRALAVLNDGGTPAALKAAAAEVARIAAAWRGSGIAADDGGLMADHLDGLAQNLSESSQITQANYDQQAEFEKVFREVTGREPSGDLAKDADILSRYGENAVTDMGYAAEVQAFERTFREVTKREPSGDLVKDADILSRYGENPLTDMGYAAEVKAFEQTFRDVTGREPSGDLAKDADILSRYGENPLTDMGYAAEVKAFEQTFRDVTGREPSGDLAKDADILSRYGENPLTDMGYDAVERLRAEAAVELPAQVEPLPEEERYEQLFQEGVKGYQADMIVAAEIKAGTTLAGDPGNRPSRLEVVKDMAGPRPTRDQYANGEMGYNQFLSDDRAWRSQFQQYGLAEAIPANDPRFTELAAGASLAALGVLPGLLLPAAALGVGYYGYASLHPDSPGGQSIRPQELIDPALEMLPIAGRGLRLGRSALRQLTGLELNPWAVTRGNVTTQRFPLTEPASDITAATARYDELVRQAGFDPVQVRNQIGGYEALRAGLDPNPYAGELANMVQDVILTGQPRSMVVDGKLLEVTPPSLAQRLGGLDFHATPTGGVFADATTVRASSTNPVEMPIFSGPHAYPRFAAGPAFGSGPYQVTDAQDNLLTDFAGQPVMSKGSFDPSVIGRDPANVEVIPKIYPIRLKSGNVIYVKEAEVIRPVAADLPAAQFSVPIGGDKMRRTWMPSTDYVSDLERSLDVRVDSAPLTFRSDVPFTRQNIVAANLQSYMDQVRSGIGDIGSIQGIRNRLASSSDPLAEPMPGGGTLVDRPGEVGSDISWTDEAPSDLSRTARQQVVGLDDSGLERLASDPTASPDFRGAASELLDVRRSRRARASEQWANDAIDPMTREARAEVAGLDDAELRRLASDPSQLPDIRRAANELITLRETARADGINRQAESERGVPGDRALVERPREAGPREPKGHLSRAGLPTLDPRVPDARIPDPRVPDPRIPDPRVPDPRIPDPRVPDPRIPDPRVPDPRIPDPRVPDARIPDPRVPDPRIPEIPPPDLTRERRVRLPEVDEAPMTVVKAEEGLYPRVIAHDELVRVYHDLDTGEVRTEPLAMPTEPIVVKHDDTPPPIESRFSGHRQITPRGRYVFTKPVGERRRKASSKRHPYLRKGELRRR